MRAKAAAKGVDLLLVCASSTLLYRAALVLTLLSYPSPFPPRATSDSGDHHDGPGLTSIADGGDRSDALLARLGYDLLAIGNHEMYKYDVARSVYEGVRAGRWCVSDGAMGARGRVAGADGRGREQERPVRDE